MRSFIFGNQVNEAVRATLRGKSIQCAVAFWGRGASNLFDKIVQEARIICNLETGATNPNEIIKIMRPGFEIRQCDSLHAKVYIGETKAVIASANASANGLGLEGNEIHTWIEAGVLLDNIREVQSWFERLWDNKDLVHEITAHDLQRAKDKWLIRQAWRPSLQNFAQFDPTQYRLPLIVPYEHLGYEFYEDNIRREEGLLAGQTIPDSLKERIADSLLEPDDDKDIAIIGKRWILKWQRTLKGLPDRRTRILWIYTGAKTLHGVWHYPEDSAARDVLLIAEETPPQPFSLRNDKFTKIFADLIGENEYQLLRSDRPPWEKLDKLSRKFWIDLHRRYIAA
jgi:hypothetical protein